MTLKCTRAFGPWTVLTLLALAALPARAVDASWSGFATLGYARSDSPYRYQREIDEDGTWRRDSLIAGQVDLALVPRWTATAQVALAAAIDRESAWRARTTWAFVGWRPNDDWLIRVGRQYAPLYLHSESLDIGMAHDKARLPVEMYSLAPAIHYDGVSASRAFVLGGRDASFDVYAGRSRLGYRTWTRDGAPPTVQPGLQSGHLDVKALGFVLTTREADSLLRLGVHMASTHLGDNLSRAVRLPRVELAPGVGYWQVGNAQPGPGVPQTSAVRNLVLTAGGDWHLGSGWRLVAEFAKPFQFDTELGADAVGGYLGLFKSMGDLTPYALLAGQRSGARVREWYRRLTEEGMPPGAPGAAAVNAAQRLTAESMLAFDQRSFSLGLSCNLSPTSKLKGEWTRTHVGEMSAHFDTPPGMPLPRGLQVNIFSVNLSVAF